MVEDEDEDKVIGILGCDLFPMCFDVDGGKILEEFVFGSKLQSSKDDDMRSWVLFGHSLPPIRF